MDNLKKYNLQFKGQRYCKILREVIKRVDLLNIISENRIKKLCKEFSFVNSALSKVYNIIFKRDLNMTQAIKKISHITDKENNPFISRNDAKQLYNKFQELNHKLRGGTDSKGNKEVTNKSNKETINSKLSYSERRVVDKTFDMMEVLLICLSLLPLAGWAFDFPLLIYSLSQKKYTLAMITVLNWYIWSFCIIFGLNVNMGPTLKASYLGNQENIVKKLLLFPQKEPTKVLNPYVKAKPMEIEGERYLIDDNGNVYNSHIKNPDITGVMSTEGKFIARDDPNYESVIKENKERLMKDKIGPTGIM